MSGSGLLEEYAARADKLFGLPPILCISIEHLRDLKAFFGTTFKIKDAAAAVPTSRLAVDAAEGTQEGAEPDDVPTGAGQKKEEYVLSCVGTGFTNTAKRAG